MMNLNKPLLLLSTVFLLTVGILTKNMVFDKQEVNTRPNKDMTILYQDEDDEQGQGHEDMEQRNTIERQRYEWLLSRDPKTGLIPAGIRAREMEWVSRQPVKQTAVFEAPQVNNTYSHAGPSQLGGRTRTIAYDRRFVTSKVMLAGGITGGIFRSTDGGANWKFVHPEAAIRSVSSIAQDPRNGFQDTWYAGTGEPIGASASYPNAFVFGNGIFKSTNNGLTWSKLENTIAPDPTTFSSQWSFVHKIVVHPTNGHIYAAVHRRITRSKDGGNSWEDVFISTTTATSVAGIADITLSNDGSKIYVAMHGRNPDRDLAGIFVSSSGDNGSFTRIAGGVKGNADFVEGWRDYSTASNAGWGRTVIALAPSNQNILYVMMENPDDVVNSKPEADLFKCDMSTTPFTWTNLTANLVAKRTPPTGSGTTGDKYIELQGGYDMLLAVHPTRPETVLAGGVNLFRSTDGFSSKNNVTFFGGQSSTTYNDPKEVSHVDHHCSAFDPTNANRVAIGSDGGVAFVKDVTQLVPEWELGSKDYQTLQYYHIGIDPTVGTQNFFGGAQDNSTTLRDRSGILGTPLTDPNDHYIVLGGDGCQVGMTKKNAEGKQFLFCAAQSGQMYRMNLFPPFENPYTKIKPNNTGDGEFVTYFHLDPDNTDFLYYVTKDSIFRTGNSAGVTAATWTLMESVAPVVSGNIFALETTRGSYTANNRMFIGTSAGKIYRIRDPQWSTAASVVPDDITPPSMAANSLVRDIAVNPRNHDTVVAVVSNYNVNSIFWTGNATAAQPTWQVIDGNVGLPSVRACEIIAKTNGIEYYIGTTAGLFSTTSISGASTVWSREIGATGQPSAMINTAIINSLAHRWSDNTLVVGTHGNGMFSANLGNATTITTAVTTPIRNNTNFVKKLYPTITSDMVNYQIGNMYSVKKLSIEVTSMNGAVVYKKETGYQNGTVPMGNLGAGTYIVTLTSTDRKYQFTQKIIKK